MSVTIKDIARYTGVSFSTVSKALNDSPLVKPETKNKILKAAKELGYEPNLAARQLVSKETKTIGLVWPSIERTALSTLVTKINDEVEKQSYSMILSINSVNSAFEMFKRFQVDGIIIFKENTLDINFNTGSYVPVISYGNSKNNTVPFIDVNYKKAMFKAVDYLHSLGHTDISFIGCSENDQRQIDKLNGFIEGMEHLCLPIKKQSLIHTGGLEWYDGYTATRNILEASTIPSAIIGGSYDLSSGIIRAINEANLTIPNDISVIGYDNIPQMAQLETPLTCIGVPIQKTAEAIVSSLLQLKEKRDSIPAKQTLEPELVIRMSCSKR